MNKHAYSKFSTCHLFFFSWMDELFFYYKMKSSPHFYFLLFIYLFIFSKPEGNDEIIESTGKISGRNRLILWITLFSSEASWVTVEPEERNLTKQWAGALIPSCKVRGNFLTLNPNGTSPWPWQAWFQDMSTSDWHLTDLQLLWAHSQLMNFSFQ